MNQVFALILLAQTEVLPPWIKIIMDFGVLGLLGYIVVVTGPRMSQEASKDREALFDKMDRWMQTQQTGFNQRNTETGAAFKLIVDSFTAHSTLMHQETLAAIERHDALLGELIRHISSPQYRSREPT